MKNILKRDKNKKKVKRELTDKKRYQLSMMYSEIGIITLIIGFVEMYTPFSLSQSLSEKYSVFLFMAIFGLLFGIFGAIQLKKSKEKSPWWLKLFIIIDIVIGTLWILASLGIALHMPG